VPRFRSRLIRVVLHTLLLTAWGLLIAICVLGMATLAYGHLYAGRIFPGVSILGIDVGGLTWDQATIQVEQALGDSLPYVTLHSYGGAWTLSTEKLGGHYDIHAAVREAWLLGRSGIFREDMITRLRLLWDRYRVIPEFQLDPGATLIALRHIGRLSSHPARKPRISIAGLRVQSTPGQTGLQLDTPATRQAILDEINAALGRSGWVPFDPERALDKLLTQSAQADTRYSLGGPVEVDLRFLEVVPPMTEIQGGIESLETILSGPVDFCYDFPEFDVEGQTVFARRCWAADRATLYSWITINDISTSKGHQAQVGIDRSRVEDFVQIVADAISRPPREGRFAYDRDRGSLQCLVPGQYGYALDVPETVDRTLSAISSPSHTVELPVRVIPPRVTLQDLEQLMPLELISVGESSFWGSTPARLQNIIVATERFHGLAVPPHTSFSFLDHLGLVTAANGYSESWVIFGNRTLLGPGGGVCQVATTFFRAVFWGGYPILERWPHPYRVGWYEPPVGLDAAVFSPDVDVRFENDTDTPILIMTEVDQEAQKLYFRFYGQKPSRTVRIEGPILSNPVPAGPPIEEVDPSLTPGTRIRLERAHDGVTATVYRVIEQPGTAPIREAYVSEYRAWPARYRVGPNPEPRD